MRLPFGEVQATPAGLRVVPAPGHEPLAAFFEQDVGKNRAALAEIQEGLAEVARGALDAWSGTVGTRAVELDPFGASLVDAFAEEPVSFSVSLDEFRRALLAWENALRVLGEAH